MKIQSKHQELSPVTTGGRSFFYYTTNNEKSFQRYLRLEFFERQLDAGNGKGLVIYEHPARSVAGAIVDGNYDNAPLQEWIREAEKSLAVIRRYRRNMLVIERDATDEQYFRSAFSAAFSGRQPPQELASRSPEAPPLMLLIALFAVRQYQPAAQLLFELEASSVAPTNELPLDDTLGMAARELHELSKRVDEIDASSKALQQQLATSDAQIKQLQAENRRLTQENAALTEASQAYDREASEILLRQVLDLESSLKQMDHTRRRAEDRARDAEGEYQNAKKEVAALKTAIDRIRKSTSWRLTAPVRAIKSVFSR